MNIHTKNYILGKSNRADQAFGYQLKLYFFTALLSFLFVPNALYAACIGTSPTWSSTVDYSSLNACVSQAKAGDTINVSGGSATYNNTVDITKPLTIIGSGETSSVIAANNSVVFRVSISSGNMRISGFGFTGNGGGTGIETAVLQLRGQGLGIWDSLRIDHCRFTNIPNHSINLGEWWDIQKHPRALFDHITFINSSNNWGRFIKIAGNADTWKQPDQYGTDFFVFIEDSNFSWSGSGQGDVTDTEHGARIVVRYNSIDSAGIQMHDTGSTQASKGNRVAEIYNNVFNCNRSGGCGSIPAMGIRGGGYLIYNNTISSKFTMPAWPEMFRAVYDSWLGQCNGSTKSACDTPEYYHCSAGDHRRCTYSGDNVCDGMGSCVVAASSQNDCPTGATFLARLDNVNGGNDPAGYPCRNQTGWGKESADGKTEEPSPVYWYNNKNENGRTLNIPDSQYATWFKQDRDYCYHGTSTSCGAKAGWTYIPYTYPHPLQSTPGGESQSTNLKAPSNLRTTL